MSLVSVIVMFGNPALVRPATAESFETDRKALTNIGMVLTLNEPKAFGYTNNEGRAVCHYLLPLEKGR